METMIDKPDDQFNLEYDFGDDADGAPPTDPAFDAWIRRAAPAVNVPGTVPTEDMWVAITAAHPGASAAVAGVLPFRARRAWRRPVALAAALAATLMLGVALDRLIILRREGATGAVIATRTEAPSAHGAARAETKRDDLYRLAAVQTLSQAEALLTAYRASDGSTRDSATARQLGGWARDVLGSTRLLIDSPAGADPEIRVLLDDIELVLVQIVRLSGTPLDSTDRTLIDNALRDRDLLPRIRTAVPAGSADGAIASDN
jgi:hypothetical protein